MTGIITLNIAGTDTGNFNLYSNIGGYVSAFAVNITRLQLLAGYVTDAIPNGTTIIRILSVGSCTNYIDIIVPPQACYNFLPTDSYYLLDTISKSTYAYAYGPFDGYIENGIATTYKNLIKLNLDLTIDTSFDVGTGFDEILYTGSSILEQPDGKIIVTGTFTTYQGVTQNRIVRLNTDATVDATFITGTGFNNFTQSPAIDSNGSIIVTGIFNTYNGSSSPRIARLLSNGTIDPTFIIGSGFNNTTTDVLVNSDDSMFILGYFDSYNGTAVSPGITKLLPNGSIDPSFNAGTGITPYVPNNANYFARIPGETSFYVGGFLTDYDGTTISQIIKLNIDGTVDTSFNSGTGFDGVNLYSLAAVWGDKLIIEGDFTSYNGTPSNYAIILNADGSVYYTFDSTYMSPIIIGDNLFGAEFDDCLQLLHTFIPQFCNLEGTGIITVPPTTTTTTTTIAELICYSYQATTYDCDTCEIFSGAGFCNSELLTLDKFYIWNFSESITLKIKITTYNGANIGFGPNTFISDSDKVDTCAELPPCYTTTTTTTTTEAPTTTTTTTAADPCLTCAGTTLVKGTMTSTIYDYSSSAPTVVAQSLNLAGTITRLGLKIYLSAPGVNYKIRMKVYQGLVTGGLNPPANTLLGSSINTIDTTTLINTSNPAFSYFCFNNIAVSGDITVILENENIITQNNSQRCIYELDDSSPYSGGNFSMYTASSWTALSGYDMLFDLCYLP